MACLEVVILGELDALLSRFLVWRLSGDDIPCLTLGLALLVRTHKTSVPSSREKEYGADILDILDILDFFEGGGS